MLDPESSDSVATVTEGSGAVLSQAIGELLPYAVGIALSPIPIIAVIVMLGTPKARSNGPAFALGWVIGLAVVSVAVALLASGADDSSSTAATTVSWANVILGVLLLAMAARRWRGRPKAGEVQEMPKWLSAVDTFTPVKSLGLGALLSGANPKNLALAAAAGASIAQAGVGEGQEAAAIAIFVALASVTVVGSVLFYVFGGSKAERPLASVKTFMTDNNSTIMMVILLIFGVKQLGEGLPGL